MKRVTQILYISMALLLSFVQSITDQRVCAETVNPSFSRPDAYGQSAITYPKTTVRPFAQTNARSQKNASADGRLSLRNYVSTDSSETYETPTLILSFLEADLHLKDLNSSGLRVDLDSTFILDISQANERRFGETERFDQIRNFSITQPLGSFTLSLGRRLITKAGNAWVDGLDARYHFNRRQSSIGVYGGLSPDRFDRSLTLKYQALGGYVSHHQDRLDLSAAYNLILNQGELDRQYLYQRTHYRLVEGLYLSNYLILDFVDDPQVTTFLSTLDYTPIKSLNFSLNLTQYSLEQYRNQAIYRDVVEPNQALILGNEVVDLTYQRLRVSASWRINRLFRPYISTELKSRAQDGRRAFIYTTGLNHQNLFSSKVDVDFQIQFAENFRTDTLIIALSLRRDLTSTLSLDARVTSFSGEMVDGGTDRQALFNEAQRIYLFGLSVVGRLTKAHQILATYDSVYESEIADYKSDESITIHTFSLFYSYLY